MKPRKYPQWVYEADKIYEPYLEGCHLVKNAPKEAKEAFEKVNEFFRTLE